MITPLNKNTIADFSQTSTDLNSNKALGLDFHFQTSLNFGITGLKNTNQPICKPPGLHSFRPKSGSISISTCSGSRDEDFSDSESSNQKPEATEAKGAAPKSCKSASKNGKSANAETYMKKYKTELCKNFEMRGYCKWGSKCCFAHGSHELRAKRHLNNKYKSKICKHYHRHGYCPYGLRCQYFHIKDNYTEFMTAFVEKFEIKGKEMGNPKDVCTVMKNMTKL